MSLVTDNKEDNHNLSVEYKKILEKYPQPDRYRHHVKSNVYFPFHKNLSDSNHYPPLISEINWKDLFLNGLKPTNIDIGCGIGKFLLQYSILFPNENTLGLEVRKNPVNWINSVITGEKIPNAAALHYSLANGLDFIENNSLQSIFYFFPDPWFKKKQSKRRVLNIFFLHLCYQKLQRNGCLYIQTDVEILHKYHLEQIKLFLNSNNNTQELFKLKVLEKNEQWNFIKTDQELHVEKKNFDIYRLILEKI